MVPSRIVVLDELPLLPNGKLDLRGLSAAVASGAHGRRPPAGAETEARVIELWAGALEVESVGGEDDFFELGGDSLAAAVIAAELHAAFGVELELRAFSEGSTPAAMARLVERLRAEADAVDDPPLVRVALVRTGGDEHQLLRAHHHVISDGWSWKVFFDELAALYEAHLRGEPSPLSPLPIQYADYAAWERRRLEPETARYRRQQAAWRRVLAPRHTPLELPFARPRPREDAVAADGVMWWGLHPGDSRALDRRAAEGGATHYMARLAIFAAQLAIETGQDDIVIGAYVTNRRRAELQRLFGLFSNLTTLRLRFREDLTLRGWLHRVRDAVIETGGRAEVPYDQVVEELGRAGIAVPEIRAVFGMTEQPPPLAFAGLELMPLKPVFPVMPWQFSFMV